VLRTVLRAWALGGIAWAALLLVGSFTGQTAITGVNDRTGGRVSLTMGDSNYAANFFLVAMLVAIACGYPAGRGRRWTGCGLMLVAIFLTGSNGGILGTALSLAVLGVISARRRFGTVFALALAAAFTFVGIIEVGECVGGPMLSPGGGLCLVHVDSLVQKAKASDVRAIADGVGRAGQSTGQREELLEESKVVFKTSSLWGIGATQIKAELARRQVPFVKEAHNDYVAALIERGALGALAILVLIATVILRLLPAVSAGLRPDYAAVIPRSEALVCAVVVMALAGWFYEVLHLRHLWALLAVLAAMGHWGTSSHDDAVPVSLVPISRSSDRTPDKEHRQP
jgi:O-antigen ligase